MPSYARYVLKESHPAIKDWAKTSKSVDAIQAYECKTSDETVNLQEVLFGLQMAMMSITDDKPGTLKNVGKMNPWQIQSLKLMVGETECFKPLTELLSSKFQLTLDHHINHSGITKAGHALDTQGFIAHNDKCVVLSYRCTTSASDWLTNLTTTTSAFEPDEDAIQGHSGFFSCFDCCNFSKTNLPLVHTGFYNNFLCTIADIKKYVDPLVLNGDDSEKTLYVAGHSLGAGIATIAACYFLLDPLYSKVKLRVVTAGGPRAITVSMEKELEQALSSQDAKFYRCVRDKDGVPNVPPEFLGFRHTGTTVFITKADSGTDKHHLIVNPELVVPKRAYETIAKDNDGIDMVDDDDDDEEDGATGEAQVAKLAEQAQAARSVAASTESESYNKKIAMIPRSLRDHMPEFYLLPIYSAAETSVRSIGE